MIAAEIELAVARHFDFARNLIVPNVFWGIGLRYEADLVIVRPSGWATEVEIKCNADDLKRDAEKRHNHDSLWFQRLYFAVPQGLAGKVPQGAGVLACTKDVDGIVRVSVMRPAPARKGALKMPTEKIAKLKELAALRIWALKEQALPDSTKARRLAYCERELRKWRQAFGYRVHEAYDVIERLSHQWRNPS